MYLNRNNLQVSDLSKKLTNGISSGKKIRAIFINNPNNPLGTVMSEDEMIEIIKFCQTNRLVLIAIESLQNSIFDKENIFKSFRYVINKIKSPVEMFSSFSISKAPFFK
jgi:aspartate/methionine/tyrosine aminotransferase